MNVDAGKLIEQLAQNFAKSVARLETEKAMLECQLAEAVEQLGGVVVQQAAPPAPAAPFPGGWPPPQEAPREGDDQPAGG